jgi:hypothetical protein
MTREEIKRLADEFADNAEWLGLSEPTEVVTALKARREARATLHAAIDAMPNAQELAFLLIDQWLGLGPDGAEHVRKELAALSNPTALQGMQAPTPSPICEWVQDGDEESDTWATTCKHMFVLNDGGPKENSMQFCCYCGHALVEVPFEDADWETRSGLADSARSDETKAPQE